MGPLLNAKTIRRVLLRALALILGLLLAVDAFYIAAWLTLRKRTSGYGRRKSEVRGPPRHWRRKPPWVTDAVIHLKALMWDEGCCKIADAFNRFYEERRNMTVSKSFVSDAIRRHRHAILLERRKIKHRIPQPMPLNKVWGVDLTGKGDATGSVHMMLGIVDHGARAALALRRLADRTSLGILLVLIQTMRRFDKPEAMRTDNEAIFTSRTFRFGLWLLGIRHERTDLHCPWQNGRVERFFGTLKSKLDRWVVSSAAELDLTLHAFRFWYNHVRTHNNLDGQTPAEVWSGKPKRDINPVWFTAWDGLLTGHYYSAK